MAQVQSIEDFVEARIRFCRDERLAYRRWLGRLRPMNWFTIGGSVILSSAASIAILGEQLFLGEYWKLAAAIMSAAAGALAALHANLRCDAHQDECARLIHGYQVIQLAYEAARTCEASELPKRRDEIEQRLEDLVGKAEALPGESCRSRSGTS